MFAELFDDFSLVIDQADESVVPPPVRIPFGVKVHRPLFLTLYPEFQKGQPGVVKVDLRVYGNGDHQYHADAGGSG
jgi:hypothetical protein